MTTATHFEEVLGKPVSERLLPVDRKCHRQHSRRDPQQNTQQLLPTATPQGLVPLLVIISRLDATPCDHLPT